MNFAYIRVSSFEQNENRQIEAMKDLNIEKYFTEKVSGKDINRPQLQLLLEFAREGDTVYIKDFSRLARSTKDLLNLIEHFDNKKVKLISLKESLDTSTSTGKLMTTVMAAIYEFERTNILERQKEGIVIAKREGKYKGRKEIVFPDTWKLTYDRWKRREITGTSAMKELDLKRTTFYKLVKQQAELEKG